MTLAADARRPRWFAPACVVVAVLLAGAYSNSFYNSFHFDDSHVIEGNLYIRSLTNIPRFFSDATTFSAYPANATYRPLVSATLAVDYWLAGGLDTPQYHVSQLTMLVMLGVMVFMLFRRLFAADGDPWWTSLAALAAAALFALHPTNTETMNLIHARSELLSAMGVVGSFLAYIYWPWTRWSYLFVIPMIVGALAKSPSVMFAPLFAVYLVLFEQRLSLAEAVSARAWPAVRGVLWRSLPVLVVGAVVFVVVESQNAPGASYGGGGRALYLQTQLFAWLHYFRLFFLPVGLSADTDWTLIDAWYDTRVIAGALFIAFLVRVSWVSSRSAALRPLAFGLIWFALTLLPASSVFPLAEVINEHRVFQPYIGLSLAVVCAVAATARRGSASSPRLRSIMEPGLIALALAVLGALAAGTYERNTVYATEETLWRDVVAKSPGNGRAWMNYGLTQMSKGNYSEARRLFERAKTLTPNYSSLEINLGIVVDRQGDPTAAEAHFKRALELQPKYPAPHFFYARWLTERSRHSEAVPHLQEAIGLSPADEGARHLLMETLARLGRTAELKSLVDDTLRLVPGDETASKFLNARGEIAVPPEPVPVDEAGLLNASLRSYQAQDFQGAIDFGRKLLEINPQSAEAYNNIAAAYASQGKWDEAIMAARTALELKPGYQLARNNMAWAESERAKTQAAATPK